MPAPTAAQSLFQEGRLSVGVMLPVRAHADEAPDIAEQLALGALAERVGFDAVWVRDVPLNGPWYPESFGHPDPMVMLGALAARTSRIVLGSGAIVLPLRHPLHVAKSAISLDRLSGGRFVLGLGAGDRPEEFAAFGADIEASRALHRAHWEQLAAALARPGHVEVAGAATEFELRPGPAHEIPLLAIGSGGQSVDWIARNARGWATYHRPRDRQKDRHTMWRRAVERAAPGQFRSFTVALRVDLDDDDGAPVSDVELGHRTGVDGLAEVLETMREDGVHHAILNLSPDGGPAAARLERVARRLFRDR